MVITTQHELQVRAIVEEKYGALPDQMWDHWCGLEFPLPDDFTGMVRLDAQQIIDTMESTRKAGLPQPKREPTIPERVRSQVLDSQPDWWAKRSREMLQSWGSSQRAVLARFGLPAPLTTYEEAGSLIERQVPPPTCEGRSIDLDYLHFDEARPDSPTVESIKAYLGPSEELSWQTQPPLWVLANSASALAEATGCELWRATSYLLCNTSVPFPYCRTEVNDWGLISITVGSPVVRASEVTAAYKRALESLRKARPDLIESAPKRKRRPKQRTLELVAFVESEPHSKKTLQDWERLRSKWNRNARVLEKKWLYDTPKSMYEAYRRAATAKGGEDT